MNEINVIANLVDPGIMLRFFEFVPFDLNADYVRAPLCKLNITKLRY